MRSSRRPSPRGFTLVETILATVIGAMVILAALGLFAAIRKSDARSSDRMHTTVGLVQAHMAIEKALRTMVLSDQPPPSGINRKPADPNAPPEPERNTPRATEEELMEGHELRMILAYDSSAPMFPPDPNAESDLMGDQDIDPYEPQRFEVTLRAAPVFDEGAATAERLRAALEGEDSIDPSTLDLTVGESSPVTGRGNDGNSQDEKQEKGQKDREDDAQPDVPGVGDQVATDGGIVNVSGLAGGVRGVFEIGPDPESTQGAVALYWRQIYPPPSQILVGRFGDLDVRTGEEVGDDNPDETIGDRTFREERLADRGDAEFDPSIIRPGTVLLASNLAYVNWEVWKDSEFKREIKVVWWEQVPGFVRVDLRTMDGRSARWMFEVAASKGPNPGQALTEALPIDNPDDQAPTEEELREAERDSAAEEEKE